MQSYNKSLFSKLFLMFAIVASANICFAAADKNTNSIVYEDNKSSVEKQGELKDPANFQDIIDEYKVYLAKVPTVVKDEIVEYRKQIAELNKQKRLIFRKLSNEAQEYLKNEQNYKKRLPIKKKNLIDVREDAVTDPAVTEQKK